MLIWLLWQYDRAVSGESVSAVSHHCRHIPPIVQSTAQTSASTRPHFHFLWPGVWSNTVTLLHGHEAATAQIGCNNMFVSLDSGMMPSNHSKVSHGALAAPPYSLWTLLLFFCSNSIKHEIYLLFITNKEKMFKTALPSMFWYRKCPQPTMQ